MELCTSGSESQAKGLRFGSHNQQGGDNLNHYSGYTDRERMCRMRRKLIQWCNLEEPQNVGDKKREGIHNRPKEEL
jgi:hypothetical protein